MPSVLCSSLPDTSAALPLLAASPLVPSPIRSRLPSGSQGSSSSPTPGATISPSLRLPMLTSPLWHSPCRLAHQVHRHRCAVQQQEPPEHRSDVVVPCQGSLEAAWFNLARHAMGGDA